MFNSLIIRAGLISSFLINVENNMRCEDLIEISKIEYSIWHLSEAGMEEVAIVSGRNNIPSCFFPPHFYPSLWKFFTVPVPNFRKILKWML